MAMVKFIAVFTACFLAAGLAFGKAGGLDAERLAGVKNMRTRRMHLSSGLLLFSRPERIGAV